MQKNEIIVAMRGRPIVGGGLRQKLEPRFDGFTNTLTSVVKDNLVLEQTSNNKECAALKYQRTEYGKRIRKAYESGEVKERRCNMREYAIRTDGVSNTLTTVLKDNLILEVKK